MKFLRDSLTKKALLLFTLLTVGLVGYAIYLYRSGVETVTREVFLMSVLGVMLLILIAFLLDVVLPLRRVYHEVKSLLTGKNYQRLEPKTIDEIGVFTHFFNEITTDLEKISYDVKERRRLSSELDIASQIQNDVLPKSAPGSLGLDIVAKNRSAAEVGGDCFDFLSSPDGKQTFVYIGDVTGHGVPAALIMMMVDTLINAMVRLGFTNGRDILVNTNSLLTPRISTRLFMTLVLLRWDVEQQKMFYTGAGHEHLLVYRAKTESVEPIRSGGIALGMIPDVSKIIQEKEIPLEVGDSVLLFTDGISEAKNKTGQMYDLAGIQESLKKHGYLPSAESIFDHVTKEFSDFVAEYVQVDDITMIVLKYTGKEGGTKEVKLSVGTEETGKTMTGKNWDWA